MDRPRIPVWFWIVAVLAVVWNGFGCIDFTMTLARNADYLAGVPEAYVAYLDTLPMWLMAMWALGVFGALAGSLLLLVRSGWAILPFSASLLGLAVTTFFQLFDEKPAGLEVQATDMVASLVIWTMAIALLVFAIVMLRKGILR